MLRNGRLLGGILLVAGTTIGAAMLALPVSTGMAGFWPSMTLFVVVWACMLISALLMLEANLWCEGDTNLISMAKQTLGVGGKVFSWITYLFLLYALTTAYIAESAPTFLDLIEIFTGTDKYPIWVGAVPLLVIFGYFVYHGTRSVDMANRALMFGMVISYLLLVYFVTPHVDAGMLVYRHWSHLSLAISVVVTSFGFHIIIPSLKTYLRNDVILLKRAIIIGSCIPLIIYIVWELVTLGVVPIEGKLGIMEGYVKGYSSSKLLGSMAKLLNIRSISIIARFFSFFAIVTSFLGVSLSLHDCLADALSIKKSSFRGRMILYMLTFVPPFVITLTYPRAFLSALEYAGAFGVATLLCLLPALMVWRGRYYLKLPSRFRAPGGKVALVIVILFALTVISMEAAHKSGYLNHLIGG